MRIRTKDGYWHGDASELMNAWRRGNDAGRGYAVGSSPAGNVSDESPTSAAEYEGYRVEGDLDPTGNIVAVDDDRIIVICDHNGPWAVDVTVVELGEGGV
jgi:hypothetical protein